MDEAASDLRPLRARSFDPTQFDFAQHTLCAGPTRPSRRFSIEWPAGRPNETDVIADFLFGQGDLIDFSDFGITFADLSFGAQGDGVGSIFADLDGDGQFDDLQLALDNVSVGTITGSSSSSDLGGNCGTAAKSRAPARVRPHP